MCQKLASFVYAPPPVEYVDTAYTCAICVEQPRECSFQPCKHVFCCMECAKRLKKCPICREPIRKRNRIIMG